METSQNLEDMDGFSQLLRDINSKGVACVVALMGVAVQMHRAADLEAVTMDMTVVLKIAMSGSTEKATPMVPLPKRCWKMS